MVEEIRKLIRSETFRAFNIVLAGGRKLPVERPYYLGISPTNRFVTYSSADGGYQTISVGQIAGIDFEVVPRSGGIHERLRRETA